MTPAGTSSVCPVASPSGLGKFPSHDELIDVANMVIGSGAKIGTCSRFASLQDCRPVHHSDMIVVSTVGDPDCLEARLSTALCR
jgi:hypothetical protein